MQPKMDFYLTGNAFFASLFSVICPQLKPKPLEPIMRIPELIEEGIPAE